MEFAHLFCIFNGSRVHQQAEKRNGPDDAPPGMYFTVINPKLIQSQHKNKFGIFEETVGTKSLFIYNMHIDHFFLKDHVTPAGFATVTFALCAITAQLADLNAITLTAAGGPEDDRYVGYKVWPKLGFDAELAGEETAEALHLKQCKTVLDVLAIDPIWWIANGSPRLMRFDLSPDSASWRKLISYICEKVLSGDPNG